MPPTTLLPNFTEGETSKMDGFSAKKAALEEKRCDLLQQLEEVETQITEVQAEYGAVYNKRNPILRLPVEVTCLIFTLAQLPKITDDDEASEDEEEENEEEEELLMEVIVSQVCRQWRSISLGFPRLWTTFYFEGNPTVTAPLERFDAYMKRSANLPLHIWFDFKQDPNDFSNIQLVEKAIDHADRWKHFTLFSGNEEVMLPLSRLRGLSAPMLEYLTLAPGVEFSDEELDDRVGQNPLKEMTDMDPRIFQGGTPKLTYLMLDDYSMRHTLPPVSNVTILRIEKLNSDSMPVFERRPFLDLLLLPSLTQLSLAGDLIEPFGRPRSVQMPNLKRFRVSEFDAIWDLLPGLRAPQLDTLIIHMCQFASGLLEGASPASPDIGYSFPSLRKLYVIDSNVEPSVLPTFTQVTRQAMDVLISHGDLQSSLLQIIINENCVETVWPRLKTLSCYIAGVMDVETFVAFSRRRPKDSFIFRLPHATLGYLDGGVEALEGVALEVPEDDDWVDLKEPFWPQDIGLGSRYDFGKDDGFLLDAYF